MTARVRNQIMTDYGWLFRGDAAGEPIMTVEDGRSRRLLRRSTSRSRLEMAIRRYGYYSLSNLLESFLLVISSFPFSTSLGELQVILGRLLLNRISKSAQGR